MIYQTMIANSNITDSPLRSRLQSPSPCNYHHHTGKQWNGMDAYRNEIFDAEHLLEDLGFAGSIDPTIPERFVPSLLHRVAAMPRTALWYLNHRILHTLILHKRKEQRRRLFRCSSDNNKELIESRSRVMGLLHNHMAEGGYGKEAGLVRALTGPADCSEKDVLSACLSACQCSTTPPFENISFPNTLAISTSTPTFKPKCPISICIQPPEDQRPESENVIDGCVLPDAANKLTNNSDDNVPAENLQDNTEDCSLVQAFSTTSNADPRPLQSTVTKSYAEFSKDQRRMVLQRSRAIGRPRSASAPILSAAQSSLNKFQPIPHLSRKDGDKSPNDTTLLPCSSQNPGLSLQCCYVPRLRFTLDCFQNDHNICINMWKTDSKLLGDNRVNELCIKNEVQRSTLTRQNYISLVPSSSKNLPVIKLTVSSDENPFQNYTFTLKSPMDFIKLAQAFTSSADGIKFKSVIVSQDGYTIPGSSFRFDTSNLESILFDCFSSLVEHNPPLYLRVAKTDNHRDRQTSMEKKSLLPYHCLNHLENSDRKIISRYLLICHNRRDKVHLPYHHHEMLNDKVASLEQSNTPPMLIIAAMADFSGRCDPHPIFLSGFNIDIGRNGSNETRFRSAVTLRFCDNKEPKAEPSTEDAAEGIVEGTVEKKTNVARKEPPSHSFFRKATKELIELQEYIKKAKITRESASAELKVMQGILLASNITSNSGCSSTTSHDDRELNTVSNQPVISTKYVPEHYEKQGGQSLESCDTAVPFSVHAENKAPVKADPQTRSENEKKLILRQLRKNILRVEQRHFEDMSRMEKELRLVHSVASEDKRRGWAKVDALQIMVLQLQNEMLRFQQALSDLQKKVGTTEESTSTEHEIRSKIQQELEEECNSRVSKMEARLKVAEQQLRILQEENEDLRQRLLLESEPNSNHHQRTVNNPNTFSPVTNGFTVNGDITCHHVEEKGVNEEKLREELRETEERADRLNLMLDEKVVELNKLQLSLSKRTKEMVLVERAYVQLIYQLYRNGQSPRKVNDISTSPLPNGKVAEEPP